MVSLEEQPLVNSFNKVFMGAAGTDAAPSDDQFNRVSFLSHFDGANNGVNNAFDDGSASNHTVTANGNVTQGSFGPFARPDGEWGWDFDGDGDSLTYTNDATMSLDGDYTFELFFNARTIVQDTQHPNTFLIGGTQLYIHSSDRYASWYSGGGNIVHSANDSILTNVWNHIAVVRSGSDTNNTSMYLNGTRVQQATNTATLGTSSGTARIGSYTASGGNFDGHISNLRLLKGTALYSGSSITVPTSALTAVTNTKLLTCQSNKFIDNSSTGFALTPVGNVAVSAFGPILTSSVYDPAVNGASASFDIAATTNLTAADSADWDFGSDNYTVELWVYPRTTGTIQGMFNHWGDFSANNVAWTLEYHSNGDLLYLFKTNNGLTTLTATDGATYANQWMHVAAVRNSNVHTLYLDGVSKASATDSGTMNNCTDVLRVGAYHATYGFDGEICDARIVKGTAVYTGNFTPPTAPLTAITNTKLLLNMKDGQAIDSAAQNNLTLVNDAKTSNTRAKFGDTSLYLDGSDYAIIDNSQSRAFGTGDFTVELFIWLNGSPDIYDYIFDMRSSSDLSYTWALSFNYMATSSDKLQWCTNVGNTANLILNADYPSLNQWVHIAVCRSGTTSRMFYDGTQVAINTSDTYDYRDTGYQGYIGCRHSIEHYIDAYMDEIRFSKTARYTSNFTAPTEPFADKGQQT